MKDIFADRILQCRLGANLNQTAVGNAVGVSRTAVSQWERGGCRPATETLKKLATLYGVTVGWLLGEVGAQPRRTRRPYSPHIHLVPVVTFERASTLGEEKFRRGNGLVQLIHTDERFSEHAFALRIEDLSMVPELRLGDIAFIEPEVIPRPGDFVAAHLFGAKEAMIRKFRPHAAVPTEYPEVDLVPLNPDWPQFTIGVDTPGRILGTVAGLRRELAARLE